MNADEFDWYDQIDATFTPRRADTLKERATPHIGKRLRWQHMGPVDQGEYEGQIMWWCVTPGAELGWAPTEDLTDIESPERTP